MSASQPTRAVVVLGAAITAIGIVLVPAPGPGWLVIALGVATLILGGVLWLARDRRASG